MIVSGKKTVLFMFAIAIGLCLWVRSVAPKLTIKEVPSVLPKVSQTKAKKGYRSKMFPSMEQARAIAEKKINQIDSEKYIITKYRSFEDGWIFDYESEKYLNTAQPKDRSENNLPIVVHKDGSTEFFSETSQKTLDKLKPLAYKKI